MDGGKLGNLRAVCHGFTSLWQCMRKRQRMSFWVSVEGLGIAREFFFFFFIFCSFLSLSKEN